MPAIELGHWAAAQQVVERWRADAHTILAAALRDEAQESAQADAVTLCTFLAQREGRRINRGAALSTLHWTAARLDAAVAETGGRVREEKDKSTGGRPAVSLVLTGDAGDFARTDDASKGAAEPVEWEEGEL